MATQPGCPQGAPRLKRPMYSGRDLYHPMSVGTDVRIAKFAVMRYEDGLIPATKWSELKPQFGPAMEEALRVVIQPQNQIEPTGNIGQATWDVLWQYLDSYRRQLYRVWKLPTLPKPNPLPDLGPLYVGGVSVLDHSLTHETAGIAHYPAYDDGWVAGRTVLAVEDMQVVSPATSSAPGEAFYGLGKSKLAYWYGHLTSPPSIGHSFRKGDRVGVIFNQGAKSHVHLGINARMLIGHDFEHHTDYSPGAPTIRTQLKEALSL